jgi:hypothetical protein
MQPELAHQLAQRQHSGERIFGLRRILAVGQAVVAAGEPRVLVHHAAQQRGGLGIGPLPQCIEGTRRGDDGVVVDIEAGGDVRKAVRHAGTAGDAADDALRLFQHLSDDAFGRTHLP